MGIVDLAQDIREVDQCLDSMVRNRATSVLTAAYPWEYQLGLQHP